MKIRLAALLEIPSILKAFMKFSSPLTLGSRLSEADLGLLQHPAINYYHKALHLGCCNSHRSASGYHKIMFFLEDVVIGFAGLVKAIGIAWTFPVEKYTWVVHFPEEPCLSPDL